MIRVQQQDFHLQTEYELLLDAGRTGAAVSFTGLVRDFLPHGQAEEQSAAGFFLQHYPGMTERVLEKIEQRARERWDLQRVTIIHRIGELKTGDQIVFVGVTSAHRQDAFAAAQFIMDILKTEAPFWKKEGDHWVEAKDSDQQAADQWLKNRIDN